ncbi:effector-associated constant component EACC1 [Nocardia sp. CA-290969]|uniref:effector-associated constant component EACC1 n=1 Tax=Nocardia sp. CA-290969 TaxID=3239986 RepID=UPI003D8EC159
MPDPTGTLLIHTTGAADDLLQLLDWFRHDDELRGRIRPNTPRAGEGQMGGLYDVLIVAVGAGGVAAALARSLTTWLTHRRSDITITLTREDGRVTVEVDAKRTTTADLIRDIQGLIDPPDGPR